MKKRTTLTILFVMAMLAASCGSDAPEVSEDTIFDIIRDGISLDYGCIKPGAPGGVSDKFKQAIRKNQSEWASNAEGYKNSGEVQPETLPAGYRGE